MRLHRLALHDFKGVRRREIAFPDSGMLVVEGPNEIGKTSMVEALDVLFEHKDSSKRAEIRAAQPVGRDVGPRVEVEMSSGRYRFTYRKQWLHSPRTELDIVRPRREQLTGDLAHARARALLAESADLPLWRALRLMQSSPLVPVDLTGSTALSAALDAASGSTGDAGSAGIAGESLLAAAEASYLRYFTQKSGQPTGEYKAAAERRAAAQEGLARAEAALEEVAADVERHERLDAEAHECRRRWHQARDDHAEASAAWAGVQHLTDGLRAAERERDLARRAVEHEGERLAERRELLDGVERREAALAAHEQAVVELRERLDPDEALLVALRHEHGEALAAEERARLGLAAAQRESEQRRAREDCAALEQRLDRIEAAARERSRCETLVERRAVAADDLRILEIAVRELDLARAAQAAGSARLSVTGLVDGEAVEVDGEVVGLTPGEPWERGVSERFEVVVPGRLSFVLLPQAQAVEWADEVAAARRRLDARLAGLGVADLEEARRVHDEGREADERRRRAGELLEDLLAGEDRAELRDRLEALRRLAADADVDRADRDEAVTDVGPNAAPPVEQARGVEEARAWHERARSTAGRIAARIDAGRERVDTVRLELAGAESLAGAVRAESAAQRARLEALRRSRPDAELDTALAAARTAEASADAALAKVQAELDRHDVEGLRSRLETLDTELPALRGRLDELDDERIRVEARLEHAGGQGRSETCDAARSELEHAGRAYARLRRHAEAARLLHTTLSEQSRAAKQAYVRPFTDALERLGRLVYGPGFEIEVDDTLRVRARILDGTRLPYEVLSTGAKEQLAILTRLACAVLVDADDGVPVVIDDALGYSDPAKLRRVCAAFGRVGGAAQVLLLTCTPGRYAAIGDATLVRW